jgi:hypothetical protein
LEGIRERELGIRREHAPPRADYLLVENKIINGNYPPLGGTCKV